MLINSVFILTYTCGKSEFYRQIAQADSKFTDEFQNKLADINAPVLILWGEEDQWIPCEQAYLLQSKIENSKLVTVPNTGHLVIEEDPVRLVKEIRSFFDI
ncbi:alpha/beta fold hydrolase [Sessilibacter corallicola]|uniref:alpha/beta fold hydrolase n=1 Tax=Sessilibacter corallicola TaxID=2904075 RepID=UPI00331304BF